MGCYDYFIGECPACRREITKADGGIQVKWLPSTEEGTKFRTFKKGDLLPCHLLDGEYVGSPCPNCHTKSKLPLLITIEDQIFKGFSLKPTQQIYNLNFERQEMIGFWDDYKYHTKSSLMKFQKIKKLIFPLLSFVIISSIVFLYKFSELYWNYKGSNDYFSVFLIGVLTSLIVSIGMIFIASVFGDRVLDFFKKRRRLSEWKEKRDKLCYHFIHSLKKTKNSITYECGLLYDKDEEVFAILSMSIKDSFQKNDLSMQEERIKYAFPKVIAILQDTKRYVERFYNIYNSILPNKLQDYFITLLFLFEEFESILKNKKFNLKSYFDTDIEFNYLYDLYIFNHVLSSIFSQLSLIELFLRKCIVT